MSEPMMMFLMFAAAVMVIGHYAYVAKKPKEEQIDYWLGAVAGNLPFIVFGLLWLDSVQHMKPNPDNDIELLGAMFLGMIGVAATLFYYFIAFTVGMVATIIISTIRKRDRLILIFVITHFIIAPSAVMALYFAWA